MEFHTNYINNFEVRMFNTLTILFKDALFLFLFLFKKKMFDEISNVLLKFFETLATNSGASIKKNDLYIYIYICTRFSKSMYPHRLFYMNKE